MTHAKATARANKTFTVQASLTLVTYDRQNIFKVRATGSPIFNPVSVNREISNYQGNELAQESVS
jgi:hypothetical protein